jgi:putative ABC transport system permease protein
MLFGVWPADPMSCISVAAVLISVALVAAWLPPRRASRIEPMSALRTQ